MQRNEDWKGRVIGTRQLERSKWRCSEEEGYKKFNATVVSAFLESQVRLMFEEKPPGGNVLLY